MATSFWLLRLFKINILNMVVVSSNSPFLRDTPGREWKMVGYLDMTDPTQRCPDSWHMLMSPRPSCGKKSNELCDSLKIATSGDNYQTVCGRFRGYQIGSPDAFHNSAPTSIETYYVDGVTITYGLPGNRHHVYTYAAGVREIYSYDSCPCTGSDFPPPSYVGSDYYCESGNPGPDWIGMELYYSDVLWDRQQCGGNESTCCNPPDLPWFCKTFPTPISEDLEIRICTDEGLHNENVAIESFELHIQVVIPLMHIKTVSVLNPNNTLRHIEITWIPVGGNVTTYTVRVVGAGSTVDQGCIVCTTSPCYYVYQVPHLAASYKISVTFINGDRTLGSHNNATVYSPTYPVLQNATLLNDSNSIYCSFLNHLSFYCVVCCSTDPSVPPDSSLYNISTTRGIEVTVSLQGLTSGQVYYCKAAATNTSTAHCVGPVVGDVKMYFSFVAMASSKSTSLASIDLYTIIGVTIAVSFVVFFSLGGFVVMTICCAMKRKSKVTVHPPETLPYETIRNDERKISSIDVVANSAYGMVQ